MTEIQSFVSEFESPLQFASYNDISALHHTVYFFHPVCLSLSSYFMMKKNNNNNHSAMEEYRREETELQVSFYMWKNGNRVLCLLIYSSRIRALDVLCQWVIHFLFWSKHRADCIKVEVEYYVRVRYVCQHGVPIFCIFSLLFACQPFSAAMFLHSAHVIYVCLHFPMGKTWIRIQLDVICLLFCVLFCHGDVCNLRFFPRHSSPIAFCWESSSREILILFHFSFPPSILYTPAHTLSHICIAHRSDQLISKNVKNDFGGMCVWHSTAKRLNVDVVECVLCCNVCKSQISTSSNSNQFQMIRKGSPSTQRRDVWTQRANKQKRIELAASHTCHTIWTGKKNPQNIK